MDNLKQVLFYQSWYTMKNRGETRLQSCSSIIHFPK